MPIHPALKHRRKFDERRVVPGVVTIGTPKPAQGQQPFAKVFCVLNDINKYLDLNRRVSNSTTLVRCRPGHSTSCDTTTNIRQFRHFLRQRSHYVATRIRARHISDTINEFMLKGCLAMRASEHLIKLRPSRAALNGRPALFPGRDLVYSPLIGKGLWVMMLRLAVCGREEPVRQ